MKSKVVDREADDESVRMRLLRQKAKRDRQRKPQAQEWSIFKRTPSRLDGLLAVASLRRSNLNIGLLFL